MVEFENQHCIAFVVLKEGGFDLICWENGEGQTFSKKRSKLPVLWIDVGQCYVKRYIVYIHDDDVNMFVACIYDDDDDEKYIGQRGSYLWCLLSLIAFPKFSADNNIYQQGKGSIKIKRRRFFKGLGWTLTHPHVKSKSLFRMHIHRKCDIKPKQEGGKF